MLWTQITLTLLLFFEKTMKHTLIKMNLVKLGKNKTTTTKSKPSKNKTKQKQTIK